MSKFLLQACASAIAAALFWPTLPLSAQEAETAETAGQPAVTDAAGTALGQSYGPEFFARFAPRNALDMVNQVPGFTIRDGDGDQRGLGQADTNVLIDGVRVASKSDGVFAQLQRIATDRVERIDVAEGVSFNIPGLSGRVVNVITRPNSISGRFSYSARGRPKYGRPSYFGGEASISGSGQALEWTLAYTHGTGRGGAGGGVATNFDGNGAVIDNRDALIQFVGDFPSLSGSAKWTSSGGTILDVNASYSRLFTHFSNDEYRRPVGAVERLRNFDNHGRGWGYELGSTLDLGVGPGRLKLIGLERFNRNSARSDALFEYADTSPDTGNRLISLTDTGEHIGRAEYSWQMLGGGWQVDAEAAFNRLTRSAMLFDLDPSGQYLEIPFPAGSGGVNEHRYEAILTHNRALTGNLTMQIGGGAEFSTLSQSGPSGLTRSFQRPKGSFSLAWKPEDKLDLSFELARRVGQLSFGDFLASVSLALGNQSAGNAQLVPQQSWEAELEATRRLGPWGSATMRVFANRIEDYLDLIPVAGGLETLGNIDNASILGASFNSTINLDQIGFHGAKLDASVAMERSRLDDPLTGEARSLGARADREMDLNLRHDVPRSSWVWGVGLEFNHYTPYFRPTEVGKDWEGPTYTFAFVEHKDVLGMTARLSVFNLTDGRAKFRRTVYDGYRDRSPVLFSEYRNQSVQPIFTLEVSGDF